MPSFACEIEIGASPEAIWPFITDPELASKWQSGVIGYRTDGAKLDEVGAIFECDIKEGRKVATYKCEVLACEPPRMHEMTMRGGCFGEGGYMIRTDLTPADPANGASVTHLASTCSFEMRGFFMKLLGGLGVMFAKKQQRKFLGNLKRMVEAQAGTG